MLLLLPLAVIKLAEGGSTSKFCEAVIADGASTLRSVSSPEEYRSLGLNTSFSIAPKTPNERLLSTVGTRRG